MELLLGFTWWLAYAAFTALCASGENLDAFVFIPVLLVGGLAIWDYHCRQGGHVARGTERL